MSYLARLKQKISPHAPECEATKVSKAAFVPFVAPDPEALRQIQATESLQRKVLAMLADNPGVCQAVAVDEPDTDPVVLALAIRGKGTCELLIPKANYDPFKIVAMIQANFGGVTWH